MATPLSSSINELSIKKLHVEKMENYYKSQKNDAPTLENVIEFVIQAYKNARAKDYDDGDIVFDPVPIPQGSWSPQTKNGFHLKIYYCSVQTFSKIGRMVHNLGVQVPTSRENSFLIILYRTSKIAKEIFALTRGTRGSYPIQRFTDYTFPRSITFRLLDPERQSKESSKRIIGPVMADQQTLRAKLAFDPNQLHKIYTGFQTCLRGDSSLLAFEPFHNQNGKIPEKTAEVEVGEGRVRFHKELSIDQYPPVLDHLSRIDHKRKTYCYEQPTPKRRKREEDRVDQFAFLEYFTPVPDEVSAQLNDFAKREVAAQIQGDQGLDLELSHPHLDDYFKARIFRYQYKRSNGRPIISEWHERRLTFPELMKKLRREVPHLHLSQKALSEEISKIHYGYKKGSRFEMRPLLHCLSGQVRALNDAQYFKLNNRWYQINEDLLTTVDTNFKLMLHEKGVLMKETSLGALTRPWQPRGAKYTPHQMVKELKCSRAELDVLLGEKVRYIAPDGTVLIRELKGAILTHPVIHCFKEKIGELLKKDKLQKEDFEKAIGSHFGLRCFDILTDERERGRVVKIKDKEFAEVLVPVLPQDHKMKKAAPILERFAFADLFTSGEGQYNEGYLFEKLPYKEGESGWLSGDRICPFDVEIFDVAHFPNTKKRIYLYQVKDGFDHKVRDACSQITNAARLMQKERDKTVDEFYKMAALPKKDEYSEYRKRVQTQVKALGKEAFRRLFKEREIVFVYAFVDSRVGNQRIRKERIFPEEFSENSFQAFATAEVAKRIFDTLKDANVLDEEGKAGPNFPTRYELQDWNVDLAGLKNYQKRIWHTLLGDTSYFRSLVARMDLLHTKAQVEGMGFRFRIMQIPRPGELDQEDYLPLPEPKKAQIDDTEFERLKKATGEDLLFYGTPWSDEKETYVIQPTLADGTCAFYALLGDEVDGVIRGDPNQLRKNFVDLLKPLLNPEGTKFTDPHLQKWYKSNLKSAIEEADKPDDPENRTRVCSKMLLGQNLKFQVYQNHKFFEKESAKEKEILTDKRAKTKTLKALGTKKKEVPTLSQDPDSLHSSFTTESLTGLETLSQSTKTHSWLSQPLQELKSLKEQSAEAKKEIIKSKETMDGFLSCLENLGYWLSDDELQMLAHVHDKRVEIAREDFDGDFGPNNHLDLIPREQDQRERVIIHADSGHYSRCQTF